MQQGTTSTTNDLSAPSWKFSMKLYNVLKEDGKNLVISPISLQLVSAMAYLGARGDTAKEMQDGFLFHPNEEIFLDMHNSFLKKLESPELVIVNKIFLEKTYKIRAEFSSKNEKHFLSTLKPLDFVNEADPSRKVINSWVEEATKNKIKDLLEPGTIDPLTKLVLVNAVHFKANWLHAFPASSTVPLPFYNTPEETVNVPMMSIKKRFNYLSSDELKAQFLMLPYKNEAFSLLIVLPFEKDGLNSVESKLLEYPIEQAFEKMRKVEVQVTIPKFKIEATIDLKESMMKLGMPTMFTEKADFSGLSEPNSEPVHVSKVIQKAFIEVNEEGTEAAAATGMVMLKCCAPITNPELFLADHPFFVTLLFENTPLFLNRVSSF